MVGFHRGPGDQKVVYDAELFLGKAVIRGQRGEVFYERKPFFYFLVMRVLTLIHEQLFPVGGHLIESANVLVDGLTVSCEIFKKGIHEFAFAENGGKHGLEGKWHLLWNLWSLLSLSLSLALALSLSLSLWLITSGSLISLNFEVFGSESGADSVGTAGASLAGSEV